MKLLTPQKCCLCLPLRKGLLCIGYIRLIICLTTSIHLSLVCIPLFKHMQDSYENAFTFMRCAASIIPQLLDLIFTVLFVIAGHKKSRKQTEVFYFYSVTMTLVYILVVVMTACNMHRFDILYYIIFQYSWFLENSFYIFIALGSAVILLQIYMTLLVRSLVLKFKARTKAQLARQRSTTSFRLPKFNISHV